MIDTIIAFAIGMFVGGNVTALILSALIMAGRSDESD